MKIINKLIGNPYWSVAATSAITTVVLLMLYKNNSTVRDWIGDGADNKIGPNR